MTNNTIRAGVVRVSTYFIVALVALSIALPTLSRAQITQTNLQMQVKFSSLWKPQKTLKELTK